MQNGFKTLFANLNMFMTIFKSDFVEEANKDYYWHLSVPATEALYDFYSEENCDIMDIISTFTLVATDMSLKDLLECSNNKFSNEQELYDYIQENNTIEVEDCSYSIFTEFDYPTGEKGFILVDR